MIKIDSEQLSVEAESLEEFMGNLSMLILNLPQLIDNCKMREFYNEFLKEELSEENANRVETILKSLDSLVEICTTFGKNSYELLAEYIKDIENVEDIENAEENIDD